MAGGQVEDAVLASVVSVYTVNMSGAASDVHGAVCCVSNKWWAGDSWGVCPC